MGSQAGGSGWRFVRSDTGAHSHEAGRSDKIGHVQGGMAIAQAGYSDDQEKRFKNYIL